MRTLAKPSVSLLTLAVSLAVCGGASYAGPPPTTPAPSPAAAPGNAAKAASSDDARRLARSNNAFALDLYAKARTQKGNIAFSPFSIATALEMAAAGAKGETAAQMQKVLHLDGGADATLDVAAALVAGYGAPDNAVTLKLANRLFGERSFTFEKPYLSRMQAAFGAPLEGVDFAHHPEDARTRINGWVAGQTNDRIKDLIPAGGLQNDARLVLTNAIYFLGDWADGFDKQRTSAASFSTSKSETKQVSTMHKTGHYGFASAPGVKVLDLPYKGGALAMTIVLPDAVDGLAAVEGKLTPAVLDGWIHGLTPTNVAVALPKLEIDPAAPLSLGEALASLGMPLAFDGAHADFTGIANPANPADRLHISKVFHKAFVKVDEKGTEAAAATGVVTIRAAAVVAEPPSQPFKADHPFLFLIRDARTNMILFMGKTTDPSAK